MYLFTNHDAPLRAADAFVILSHARRRIAFLTATGQPNGLWLAEQLTEAIPWETHQVFGTRRRCEVLHCLQASYPRMGIRVHPVAFRSPSQNGYVERLIEESTRMPGSYDPGYEAQLRRAPSLMPPTTTIAAHRSLAKTRTTTGQSSATVLSLPIQSLAYCITDTQESNIRYKQDNRHAERDQETHSAPQIHRLNGLRV